MIKENNILNFIKVIRESFGSSIAVYRFGNCYQFYEILKSIFPEAEAFESGGHVFTKINDEFYDIRGKKEERIKCIPVENKRIKSFTINKWSDERRNKLKETYE